MIVEYKLTSSENVINQSLYYLDWLVDHNADFSLLVVQMKLVQDAQIDWTSPRVLCVADGFGKHDSYAVQQIDRNVELVQYKFFADRLLLVHLASGGGSPPKPPRPRRMRIPSSTTWKTTSATPRAGSRGLPAGLPSNWITEWR